MCNGLQEFSVMGPFRFPRRSSRPVRSEFAEDPDFAELIEFFVEALPERRDCLINSYQAQNFEALRIVAHQLKGAGGGYGFSGISTLAAQLEEACQLLDEEKMSDALEELLDYMSRVTI